MFDRADRLEVDAISAAFELALTDTVVTSALQHADVRAIRQLIAAGILDAAQDGVIDVEDLATEGLRALSTTQATSPASDHYASTRRSGAHFLGKFESAPDELPSAFAHLVNKQHGN